MSLSAKTWRYQTGSPVAAVGIAADGHTVVATTLGKQVLCLNGDGELRWLKDVGNQAWRAAISANGQTCVVGTGSTRPWDMANRGVYCFDADAGLQWQINLGASVWGLDMAADGQTVAVGTTKQLICLDGQGHRLWEENIPGFGWSTWVWSAALSAEGQRLAAGAADKNIRLLDRSGNSVSDHRARGDVFSVAISADGTAIGAGDNARFVYWLNGQGYLLWEQQLDDKIWAITIDQPGQRLIVGAGEKERHLYCFNRDGQQMWIRHVTGSVSDLALSYNGQRLVAGTRSGGIHIFDENGEVLTLATAEQQIRQVAISATGEMVVAGSEDGCVYGFRLPPPPAAAESVSTSGKYNINISGPVTGLTIGDGVQVTQNFGATSQPASTEALARLEARLDDIAAQLSQGVDDLKRGQHAIYRRIEPGQQAEVAQILEAVQAGNIAQTDMQATLNDVHRAMRIALNRGLPMDAELRAAITDLTEAVESSLSLDQKLELALPLVPLLLNYKIELGAGSDLDLHALWDELQARWRGLLTQSNR